LLEESGPPTSNASERTSFAKERLWTKRRVWGEAGKTAEKVSPKRGRFPPSTKKPQHELQENNHFAGEKTREAPLGGSESTSKKETSLPLLRR